MADKKLPKVKVVIGSTTGKLVRFSYLNVHAPRMSTESGKEEFSVYVMIPKENIEDIKTIKDAIAKMEKEVWYDNKLKLPPKFHYPLKDGDTDTNSKGVPLDAIYHNHYVINCKTGIEYPPAVVGTTRDERGRYIALKKSEVKSGDWGRVSVMLGAYTKGSSGVGAYLSNIQLVRQGEALAGGSSAEDDFSQFADEVTDDELFL